MKKPDLFSDMGGFRTKTGHLFVLPGSLGRADSTSLFANLALASFLQAAFSSSKPGQSSIETLTHVKRSQSLRGKRQTGVYGLEVKLILKYRDWPQCKPRN